MIEFVLIFMAGLILAPLFAHICGSMPATLFFFAAAAFLIFGVLVHANLPSHNVVLGQFRCAADQLTAYYHVSHGQETMLIGIAMAVMGGIIWLQTRFGAMRYPKLTKLLFWLLQSSLVAGSALKTVPTLFVPMPRRYIDYPEFYETLMQAGSWSNTVLASSLIGLAGLLIASSIAKVVVLISSAVRKQP